VHTQLVEFKTRGGGGGCSMSLKHGLLGLLNCQSMTGYELDKEFKESLAHFWQAKPQQIYRELNAMEQAGWLTSERIPQEDKPNRRVYSITSKGKAEYLDWLASPGEDIKNATRVKNAFFMRLFFAGDTNLDQALELLHGYREQCLIGMKEMDEVNELYDQTESSHDPEEMKYIKLIMMHGEMMRKTRLAWVEKALIILNST